MTLYPLNERVASSLARVCGADVVQHVQCDSQDGHIRLAGTMPSRNGLAICRVVAWTVPGVRSLENQLTISNKP